jgi:hypothetical protein
MVFDAEENRAQLVAALRLASVREDIVAWLAQPATDLQLLSTAAAVPFWDEVLPQAMTVAWNGLPALPEALFELAAQAYLQLWRAELDQREMFDAAHELAQAAQAHLSSRDTFED